MPDCKTQLNTALDELFTAFPPKPGVLLVVGCSTSEVIGKKIGTGGSLAVAEEFVSTLLAASKKYGFVLACQCCEHLNRALVVERAVAEAEKLPEVTVVPHEHAGGSLATAAYHAFSDPCVVEEIHADYGMDIGSTLIGMHLKRVAVPVRLSVKFIGEAPVTFARTRPKYIGGPRAQYN